MKITEKGYDSTYYYYWAVYENGGMYISNKSTNYVMKKYNDKTADTSYTAFKNPQLGYLFGSDLFPVELRFHHTYHGADDYWDHPKDLLYTNARCYIGYYPDYYGRYRVLYDSRQSVGSYWQYILEDDEFPTVSGEGANISSSAGNDTVFNTANAVNINVSSGDDSILNEGSEVMISGDSGDDFIGNYDGHKVTIDGGDGNDLIDNYCEGVIIKAGGDDDRIYNYEGGNNANIEGGAGNDYIYNGDAYRGGGSNATIDGGEGNDSITNYGDNVSIVGGTGNDSLMAAT